jgi:two-component system NtrC family sensor kinase
MLAPVPGRALLVDAEAHVARELHDRLVAAGFEVDSHPSATSARSADVVGLTIAIFTLDLPDGDGLSLLEALRARGLTCPVVAIAASASPTDRIRSMRAGVSDLLHRPIEPGLVVARCTRILRRSQPVPAVGGPLVLILEATAPSRRVLEHLVESSGYRTRAVASIDEATTAARAVRPNGVLIGATGLDEPNVARIFGDDALAGVPKVILIKSWASHAALAAHADLALLSTDPPTRIRAALRDLIEGARGRVLLVGVPATSAARRSLAAEGHDLLEATTLQGALDAGAVDCVIIGQDAEAARVCPRLRATSPLTPLIALGHVDDHADDVALDSGIAARVRVWLRRRRLEADASRAPNRSHDSLVRDLATANRDLSTALEELARARDVAERHSRFTSEFLARMSHELRTPLNAVIGFAELLEQGQAGPLASEQARYVEHIVGSARHLLALVNDVLDLSKVAAGKMTLERSVVPLDDIVLPVAAQIRPLAERKHITLTASSVPVRVNVDPLRVRQILLNLLSNAIKFTPERGHVAVECRAAGEHLSIDVADDGVGIAAEDLERVFREFEQARSSQRADGTGLGLPLALRFAELHGGTIHAKSRLGRGSVFTLRMPVVTEDEPSMARTAEVVASSARPLTVLLLEDEPLNRELARVVLGHRGHAVIEAVDVASGIEAIDRSPSFDVALLDLHVPGGGGVRVLEHLKRGPHRDVPAIAFTASALGEDVHLTGFDGRLLKPIDTARFASQVEAHARAPAAADTRDDAPHDALDRLRAHYREHVLPQALAELGDTLRANIVDGAIARAHRLAGSAGSFGATEVSVAARAIERAIETAVSEGVPPDWSALIRVCDGARSRL